MAMVLDVYNMEKEQARRKRWNSSEKGKASRAEYDKQAYDKFLVRIKKGVKAVYMDELAKDGLSMQGYLNNCIMDYLKSKGYTDSDLERIHEQAKKEEL